MTLTIVPNEQKIFGRRSNFISSQFNNLEQNCVPNWKEFLEEWFYLLFNFLKIISGPKKGGFLTYLNTNPTQKELDRFLG